MRRLVLAAMLLAAAGCRMSSQGFDRGAMRQELRQGPVTQEITDSDISRVMALRPQVQRPLRLGVYFVDDGCYYWRHYSYGGKWSGDDRDLGWLEPLKREGMVSEVIPVADIVPTGDYRSGATLKDIRLAAARCGADVVLVVNSASSVDEYFNASSVLYVTIVGLFVVPGTHIDAMVITDAALFDVRNEYLYMTSQAEGEGRQMGPQTIKAKDSIDKARSQAMKEMREDVLTRMRRMF